MVEVTGLTKCYGKHTAVDHISFHLEKGRIYGLLGPNGAGKSTTIKMLTGCLFPTEGSITINGYDLLEEPEQAKACIGYLPERPPVYPAMTPREYLMFLAELKGVPKAQRRAQVEAAMERTQITSMQNRLIHSLSKGYTQRVGIAQLLLGQPKVLVLDEPLTGLDPAQIMEMRTLFKELGEEHTILFSSHILAELGMVCHRALVLAGGRLLADRPIEALGDPAQTGSTLSLTICCTAEQAKALFADIPQVVSMEIADGEAGECHVQLHQIRDADVQSEVLGLIQQAGYRLRQMSEQESTLEEAFLSLITQQEQRPENQGGEAR